MSWQPDRLGHVIHVNDRLKSEIIKQRVGVELCLSCNVHAKMITGSFGDHHLGWWRGAGVGVALSVGAPQIFRRSKGADSGYRRTMWEFSAAHCRVSIT